MTREMKNSGVEWIGDIPSEWKIYRLKTCFTEHTGGAWGDEPQGNKNDYICIRVADFDYDRMTVKNSDVYEYTKRNYTDDTISKLKLDKNDILIEKSGGGEKTPVGRTIIFKEDFKALYANFIEKLKTSEYALPKFMQYLLVAFYKNKYTIKYIKQTTGIQNLDISSMLANEKIALPSLSEQTRISDFLDSEVTQIDKIISETKASIENYKEYKQSVITEAVTKGLDKNVPMKDSGIEWIGEIPVNWEVYRLKTCFTEHTGGAWGDEPQGNKNDYICIRVADFDYDRMTVKISDVYEYTKRNYTDDTISKLKLDKNDILIEKSGGGEKTPVGRTIIFKEDFKALYANFIEKLKTSEYALPKFMQYLLVAFYKNKYTIKYIKQTTGIQNLDISSMLANEKIVLPALPDQGKIVNFLDGKVIEIDNLILEKEKLITNLEEYKKSLIYEYVTGKKPV